MACALVKLVVLPLGFLVGQPCFPQSPPYRIRRDSNLMPIFNDCLHALDSPEVRLVSGVGSGAENDSSQPAFGECFQYAWSPASRPSMESCLSFRSIALQPALDGLAVGSKHLRDKADCHASLNCSDRTLAHVVGGIRRSLCHVGNIGSSGNELYRMGQIFCGGPYLSLDRVPDDLGEHLATWSIIPVRLAKASKSA